MQERLIAAVDLGSFKTSLSVSKVENGGTQVLYYRELPSEGVLRGNVFNPKKACGPLRTLLADAQESLGINISSIQAENLLPQACDGQCLRLFRGGLCLYLRKAG